MLLEFEGHINDALVGSASKIISKCFDLKNTLGFVGWKALESRYKYYDCEGYEHEINPHEYYGDDDYEKSDDEINLLESIDANDLVCKFDKEDAAILKDKLNDIRRIINGMNETVDYIEREYLTDKPECITDDNSCDAIFNKFEIN